MKSHIVSGMFTTVYVQQCFTYSHTDTHDLLWIRSPINLVLDATN